MSRPRRKKGAQSPVLHIHQRTIHEDATSFLLVCVHHANLVLQKVLHLPVVQLNYDELLVLKLP